MKMRLFLVMLVLIPGLASVRGTVTAQDDLRDFTLFLGFIPNIQFAPIYVALEKGYFAEAGANVTLEYGDENIGVERLAIGELSFGIISGEQVILARAGERPLVYVFEWWQRFPVAVVAPVDTGIAAAGDLAGRVVGIPGRFGASYTGLRALLAANELDESDLQLEEIGFNAAAMVCADRVEAAVVYVVNEPVQIREQCSDVNIIEISPQVDLLGNGLVTNEQTIASDPELVRGMVRAMSRAVADVLADPDEAIRISRKYVETLPVGGSRVAASIAAVDAARALQEAAESGQSLSAQEAADLAGQLLQAVNSDEVVQMRVLRNSAALWGASRLGETDSASWDTTMNTLIDMGLLAAPVDLTGAFTNEFLP